jgi:hypothetical protein
MRAIAVLTLVLGLSCGGSEVRCGEGTTLKGTACVADSQCGQGTKTVQGRCVAAAVALVLEAAAELESLADRICKCKDKACSDRLMSELESLGQKYGSIRDEDMTKEQREQVMKHATRIGKCAQDMPMGGHMAKARNTEARQFVKKMYDGARAYYMSALGSAAVGGAKVAAQFPEPSAGPVPPLGTCCKSKDKKCMPEVRLWTDDTWVALQFSVDDPHFYSYQYEVDNKAKTFVVSAFGDLDCDGVYSTFRMSGKIDAQNPDGPTGTPSMFVEKELE